MQFSETEIEEFKNEALEMLEDAESKLLEIEKGSPFKSCYDTVFRVFHSLKGGAGMLGLETLQGHMHQIESQYQTLSQATQISKEELSYFLGSIDYARKILSGRSSSFDYQIFQTFKSPSATQAKPSEQPSSASGEPPAKIFILDDEEEIVQILSELVQECDFPVHPIGFTSPQEALKKVKTEKPQAFFTDMKMPSLSGLDILKAVSQEDPELPIIFVSGYLSKETILEAIRNGIFGVIEKPFSKTQIITMCTNAVQKYQLTHLLQNAISFIYYQYSDLDSYLQAKGNEVLRKMMAEQFRILIETRRKLKKLRS